MSKKSGDNLEKNDSILWEVDIDVLVQDLNKVCKLIGNDDFFKFFKAWKMPIISLIGDTPCFEFLTVLYEDWKDKKKPLTSTSASGKAFQRDARILLERLVYEYIIGYWSGTGDSKFEKHVKHWKERLKIVDANAWNQFIEDGCEGKFGNSKSVSHTTLKPLLCYYYALKKFKPNDNNNSYDVDHIIPKASFSDNNNIESALQNSLINLAYLPKDEKMKKGDNPLSAITQDYTRAVIEQYEDIKKSDQVRISGAGDWNLLREVREVQIRSILIDERLKALTN